jgi:small neutral amino acid transporter SnatA (MarC family)
MSVGLVVLGFVGIVNPARVRLGLSATARLDIVALGSLVVLGAAAGLAAGADRFLDALDVSPESFRLAAGFVLAFEGAWTLVRPRPYPEPVLPNRLAAFVPVAFPLLLTPGLVVLSLAAGADLDAGQTTAALLCALALLLPTLVVERSPGNEALLAAGARVVAVAEIVAAAGLALEGLRAV